MKKAMTPSCNTARSREKKIAKLLKLQHVSVRPDTSGAEKMQPLTSKNADNFSFNFMI
jgi:hypothetical protein